MTHLPQLPGVLAMILSEAFDVQAIMGGLAGSAVVIGIKRGLFSNEAGMGSAPNAAASASVSHPAKQGMVQVISVFIDTLLICSATAMMLLLSGVQGEAGWNSVCAESDFCKCGNMGNPLYHGIHFCVCIQQSDR